MGGRVVEGTGLENRQTFKASRGFESLPIRQGLQDETLEHDPEKWEPVFRKDHAQL